MTQLGEAFSALSFSIVVGASDFDGQENVCFEFVSLSIVRITWNDAHTQTLSEH